MGALSCPAASAHDVVLESTPRDGASVAEFPHQVTMKFSGVPKPNFNTVAVSNADTGEIVFSGSPELDGQLLTVSLPVDINPGPGTYAVGYQITSSDGHATRGKIEFSVAASGKDAEPAARGTQAASEGTNAPLREQTDQPDANSEEGSSSAPLITGGVVLILAVVAAAAIYIASKKRK